MPPPIEYLVFCAVAAVAVVCLHLWLRRRHRSAGLPLGVIAAVGVLLVAGGWLVRHNEQLTVERLERAVIGLAPTYAAEVERLGHAPLGLEPPADDPTCR